MTHVDQISMVGLPRESAKVGDKTSAEVAVACFEASGLSIAQWNALSERERTTRFRQFLSEVSHG